MNPQIEDFKGLIFKKVEINQERDEILFWISDTLRYKMYHDQDCCEDVHVEDLCGDLEDLVGSKILIAHESSNEEDDEDGVTQWTFYHLATQKGWVTIRWYGWSNGYYGTGVSITQESLE
jgi:hypothetical protein